MSAINMASIDMSGLREAGLTDGEIKVYLAMVELGLSTTGPIIKKSGIARSIIYEILEKLMQKGLISYIIKEKRHHYQVAEPQKLLDYIDEREKRLRENRARVESILPQLLVMKAEAKESEAQIYEGFKGIQTVHERTYLKLKKGEGYYNLGISAFQDEKYHRYWQKDHVRRAKAGIRCRLLFNQGTDPKVLKNRNSYRYCDARCMPTAIKTPAWIMGYKDVTVIGLQSRKGLAVEIINQEIADSFKQYFEEFWKQTKRFSYKK